MCQEAEEIKRSSTPRAELAREGLSTDEPGDLAALRRENRVLKMEKQILGKAAAFFATASTDRPK